MKHLIDWSKPARLVRAKYVAPFGDGYRQISGPTIAEGSVDELLKQLASMPKAERDTTYVCSESGNPLTYEELREQAAKLGHDIGPVPPWAFPSKVP